MNADEIITAYENEWRAMALAGTPQFYGHAAGGEPGGPMGAFHCAWLIPDIPLQNAAYGLIGDWRCQEPDCTWKAATMGNAMIHINNRHHRSFEWFSKNFRDVWARGQR